MRREEYANFIKHAAATCGFDYCGIARAEKLDQDAHRLETWLKMGMQGSMGYMEKNFDKRTDPTLLVPGAKSVITLLKNYYPSHSQVPLAPRISKYAFGRDYHLVIKEKLGKLITCMESSIGKINGRGFIDSAPVLERSWAVRSGLGWIGKNGNLLTKQSGSFFFIATLIVDIAMDYDEPFSKDYCGSCTRCIDACPTDAIGEDKRIDGSRCISYFTIELKDLLIPDTMKGRFENWIFGCDICQDVCPWNRFSKPHREAAFEPIPEILNLSTREWIALTEEGFQKIFKDSPLKRSKFSGIRRNLNFIAGENSLLSD